MIHPLSVSSSHTPSPITVRRTCLCLLILLSLSCFLMKEQPARIQMLSKMPSVREDESDSDGSLPNSCPSPQSTATDATSVGTSYGANGCHKRKRDTIDLEPQKRSRMGICVDGRPSPKVSVPRAATGEMSCVPQRNGSARLSNDSVFSDECGGLPLSIWESVCRYLPPNSLGNLLQVNRVFHWFLTMTSPKPGGGTISKEPFHKATEKIWIMARRRYHPHLPRPLHGYRELDMWRLIGGSRCQFCVSSTDVSPISSYCHVENSLTCQELDRVDIYWPLAVRSCRKCLGKQFATVCRSQPTIIST